MSRFTDKPIVAPIDFSDEADTAVAMSLELAATADEVHLIHVAPPLVYFEPLAIDETFNETQRRKTLLDMMAKRYADSKYRGIRFEVRFGDPGQEIVAQANDLGAGLIVLPSHGRTGRAQLLIGSVAERVVRLANCPVLVLRGLTDS